MKVCPSCGVTLQNHASFCTACGYEFAPTQQPPQNQSQDQYRNIHNPRITPTLQNNINYEPFIQSKRKQIAFASLFLGFTGMHKFQTGKKGLGFLYLIGTMLSIPIFFYLYYESGTDEALIFSIYSFVNTLALPGIISTIEAIRYFCLSDEHFREIYKV